MGIKCFKCGRYMNPDHEGVEEELDEDPETGKIYGRLGLICANCPGYQIPLTDKEIEERWNTPDGSLDETCFPIREESESDTQESDEDDEHSELDDVDLPY